MDVSILSGMIKELILDHDSLALPGLGTFVAEDMPASFSDRGYTINPPYRRLTFSGTETSDGLLAALYAGSNPQIEEGQADAIISAYLSDLADTLRREKVLELPGLGRLRATKENYLFFVADEDLDISPEACGLAPVSLKSHVHISLPDILSAGPSVEAATANTTAEATQEPQTAEVTQETETAAPKRRKNRALAWTAGAAGALFALLLAFVLVSRLAPGSTDRILYNQEELAIINYPEDGLSLPR
jgi:nucleoid DNA-binding protein